MLSADGLLVCVLNLTCLLVDIVSHCRCSLLASGANRCRIEFGEFKLQQ